MAVHLRRGQRRVTQQLLDRAEVCTPLEEMRREGMTQAVGVGEEPSHGARVETASSRREEERIRSASRERRARVAQVDRHPVGGFLAERHDALLAALATHVHELLLEVDVSEVEPDRLGASEARGVDELDESSVADRERAVAC